MQACLTASNLIARQSACDAMLANPLAGYLLAVAIAATVAAYLARRV
jgi:hypothetical protein